MIINRDDRFIDRPATERPGDRPDDHVWRLIVASSSEHLRVLVGARNVGLIVAGACCTECAAVVGS
jgi:hypothetical protein